VRHHSHPRGWVGARDGTRAAAGRGSRRTQVRGHTIAAWATRSRPDCARGVSPARRGRGGALPRRDRRGARETAPGSADGIAGAAGGARPSPRSALVDACRRGRLDQPASNCRYVMGGSTPTALSADPTAPSMNRVQLDQLARSRCDSAGRARLAEGSSGSRPRGRRAHDRGDDRGPHRLAAARRWWGPTGATSARSRATGLPPVGPRGRAPPREARSRRSVSASAAGRRDLRLAGRAQHELRGLGGAPAIWSTAGDVTPARSTRSRSCPTSPTTTTPGCTWTARSISSRRSCRGARARGGDRPRTRSASTGTSGCWRARTTAARPAVRDAELHAAFAAAPPAPPRRQEADQPVRQPRARDVAPRGSLAVWAAAPPRAKAAAAMVSGTSAWRAGDPSTAGRARRLADVPAERGLLPLPADRRPGEDRLG
jgi:hypothetical protein